MSGADAHEALTAGTAHRAEPEDRRQSKRVEALFVPADDLTKKQLALESLNERLGHVDDLEETSWQPDLPARAARIRRLRGEIQEFTSRTEAAKLPTAWRRSRRAGGVRRAHDGVSPRGARTRAKMMRSSAS